MSTWLGEPFYSSLKIVNSSPPAARFLITCNNHVITSTPLVTKLRESGQGGGPPLLENLDPGHDWAEKAAIGIVCFIHDECVQKPH